MCLYGFAERGTWELPGCGSGEVYEVGHAGSLPQVEVGVAGQ